MKAVLRGISGPGGGSHVVVEDGVAISVGRNATNTVSIPTDRFASGSHFEITISNGHLFLRDLGSSNGTFVNGERVREYGLLEGDSILAGESVFQLQFGAVEPPSVMDVLSSQAEPLYAVLDTARDPEIYPLLLASGAYYWCLYTGQSARTSEAVAPYLLYLPPECELLRKLVAQGWGKSWGIYLTSSQPPQTIWHELRRSLMVTMKETGKWVYFRFYDPRVLRVFLPTTDARQQAEFVGTTSSFLMEDEDPELLLRFHSFATAGARERLKVRVAACARVIQPSERGIEATALLQGAE
jgi:Domain of unknown function (DUF4123)/FHA domain